MFDWATAAAQVVIDLGKAGLDFVRGTRKDALDSQAAAKDEVIESVGESLNTENDIRKKQAEVDKNGGDGMNFDKWNANDTQPAEPSK